MSITTHIEKGRYRTYLDKVTDAPVFAQPWFLDVVCGADQWFAIVVEKKGEAIGAMAFAFEKAWGQRAIVNRKMQPYTCILIDVPSNMKGVNARSREKEVVEAIAANLPNVDRVNIKLYHNVQNWLPFYWKGFQQTTFYTYVIESRGRSVEDVQMDYRSSVRSMIKKARKTLTTTEDLAADVLIEQANKTFALKNKRYPNDPDIIRLLHRESKEKGVGKLMGAVDDEGNIHATMFLLEDERMVYYLLGASDPEYRNTGGSSLLLDEAIAYAIGRGKAFNFEGSMDQGIESFFRSFGSEQMPLMKLSLNRSLAMRLYDLIKR